MTSDHPHRADDVDGDLDGGIDISVVVVTYDDQAGLDRVLDALEAQQPAGIGGAGGAPRFEVIVADDGSPSEPVLGTRGYPVRLVHQPDRGFRAAAARNLGARAARGDVLLFLDGDTVPEPGYVAGLAAVCAEAGALAPGPAAGRGLAVGRRRHADLAGLDATRSQRDHSRPAWRLPEKSRSARFLARGGSAPEDGRFVLPEPEWLAEGLAATANLRRPDERSYRFVISAVLALTRELFEITGGFDESFIGYGGEDWDLANRCYLAGAEFVHEPRAVAWHDGPDAGARDAETPQRAEAQLARKNAEIRRLAEVITEPRARDPRVQWEIPDIAVDLDTAGWAPEPALRVCAGLLHGSDARVWLSDPAVLEGGLWPGSDPRVQVGPVPERVRARSRYRVQVAHPVVPARMSLGDLCAHGSAAYPGLVVTHARDASRGIRPAPGDVALVESVSDDRRLEAIWGGWAR